MLTTHGMAGPLPQAAPMSSRGAVEAAIIDVLTHAGYRALESALPDTHAAREDDREIASLARSIRRLCDDGAEVPLRIWLKGHPLGPVPDPRRRVVACSALGSLTDSGRQLVADAEAVRALLEALGTPYAGRAVVSADEVRQVTAVFATTADLQRTEVATLTDHGEKPALDAGLRIPRNGDPVRLTVLRLDPGVLEEDLSTRFSRAVGAAADHPGDRRGWSISCTLGAVPGTDAIIIDRLRQLLSGPWFLTGDAVDAACARLGALLETASGPTHVRVVRSVPQRDRTLVYLAVTSRVEHDTGRSTRIDIVNAGIPRRV